MIEVGSEEIFCATHSNNMQFLLLLVAFLLVQIQKKK